MPKRKQGLSRDEHTALGEELYAMRNRLGKIAVQLSAAYSVKLGDETARAQKAVDRVRSLLDDIVFREYPNLSTHANARVYYPGVDQHGPKRRPRR